MNAGEHEQPKLTPTQRLHEVTIAALTRESRKAAESVEISRNAKGDVQFTVSVAAQDGETLKDASDRAEIAFDHLSTKYPTAEGTARRVE